MDSENLLSPQEAENCNFRPDSSCLIQLWRTRQLAHALPGAAGRTTGSRLCPWPWARGLDAAPTIPKTYPKGALCVLPASWGEGCKNGFAFPSVAVTPRQCLRDVPLLLSSHRLSGQAHVLQQTAPS